MGSYDFLVLQIILFGLNRAARQDSFFERLHGAGHLSDKFVISFIIAFTAIASYIILVERRTVINPLELLIQFRSST